MTRKNAKYQHSLFSDRCSDLPLFSGTAPTGYVDSFVANEVETQTTFAQCGACLDTGLVDNRPCFCAAGDAYRERKRQKPPECEFCLDTGVWPDTDNEPCFMCKRGKEIERQRASAGNCQHTGK